MEKFSCKYYMDMLNSNDGIQVASHESRPAAGPG